jgi:IS4 transposase
MARPRIIPIRKELNKLIHSPRLEKIAEETGVVQRHRKVQITALFWTLVLGFAVGGKRTIASLRRAFEMATGVVLVPSAFYDRFTAEFALFMKRMAGEVLDSLTDRYGKLQDALAPFRELLVTDSTVVRLHRMLEKKFPACRTNHTKAAAKLHVVMNVKGAGLKSIKLTSERRHDGPVLTVGKWIRDTLILFDLGYFCWHLFDRINRNGGFFISRLKSNANPTIVAVNHPSAHHARTLVGMKVKDALTFLRRQTIDVVVELSFKKRKYRDKSRRAVARYRLVGVRDPIFREYFLYITNVSTEKLSADDIARTYSARWWVELLFRQMKEGYRLEHMPSGKQQIVETLLYATVLTVIAGRCLMNAVRRKLKAHGHRVREQRFAIVLASVAMEILFLMVQRPVHTRLLLRHVSSAMLVEAIDPNASRKGLIGDVETRTHSYDLERRFEYGP